MQERVKPKARKKKILLEIDAELAADAMAKSIDMVTLLEHALRARLATARPSGLTGEERQNLQWSERYVAEHGSWWDDAEKP